MSRKDELINVFKDIEPNQQILIIPLIDEVLFLEQKMIELKKLPFIKIHPKNSAKQETTPAAKQYKECSQSYMNAIRILCSLLHKQDKSAENDLLKKLSEFMI